MYFRVKAGDVEAQEQSLGIHSLNRDLVPEPTLAEANAMKAGCLRCLGRNRFRRG